MNGYVFQKRFVIVVLMMVTLLLYENQCFAQAVLVRKGAQEIIEMVGKKLGREGTQELAEKLGREGVEEILEHAAKEGGEEAVERIVRLGSTHGARALRVLKDSPVQLAKALDGLPASQVKGALNAIERQPKLLSDVVSRYGTKALTTELKHPGVGAKVVASLGDDAVRAGKQLTTDQMIRFSRHADDIARLPASQRKSIVDMLEKTPGKVINALETHPKVLTACTALGIGVPVGMKAFEGTTEETRPDGTRITNKGILVDGGASQAVKSVGKDIGSGLNWAIKAIGIAVALAVVMLAVVWTVPRISFTRIFQYFHGDHGNKKE